MTCYVTVSVISESVTGDIGDDWEYQIAGATIGDDGLPQAGTLRMPEHEVDPGASPKPPPEPNAFTLNAGQCGALANVTLTITATEVDLLFDDTATSTFPVSIQCPGPGAGRNAKEQDVAVTVKENLGIATGGRAKLHLKLSIVAECKAS
jgi:hypothetical protein